jgi:hypothetical protein
MSNPIAEQLIEDLTYQKISQNDMFTAFDISVFAKKEKGMTERHRNVKHVVHDLFVSGRMSGYDRTLIDIPGATEKAFLYHPIGADISQYNAKDRSKFPNAGGSATATANGITVTSSTPAPTPSKKKGYGVDRRGRLCVRNSFIKAVGWSQSDAVYVRAENGGLVLSLTYSPTAMYDVDKDFNIRISPRTLRKCGIPTSSPNDIYDIQIQGSDIFVTKL